VQRAAIFVAVIMIAAGAIAQDDRSEELINHGEFAILLLKVTAFQEDIPGAAEALDRVKRLELVPADWVMEEYLTHGEFADILLAMGVTYLPNDREERASRAFVEAMLRRELWKLRDYLIALIPCIQCGPIESPSEF
jgi:hypothetical protein